MDFSKYRGGPDQYPIYTVTQGTTGGTFTVSGLNGNSGRIYRLVWHMKGSLAQCQMLFNGGASVASGVLIYNLAGIASISAFVTAGINGGASRIVMDLFLKSGTERYAICHSVTNDAGDLYSTESRVSYTTTTGNITSVALTSTSITAGATCDVYDAGVAR